MLFLYLSLKRLEVDFSESLENGAYFQFASDFKDHCRRSTFLFLVETHSVCSIMCVTKLSFSLFFYF